MKRHHSYGEDTFDNDNYITGRKDMGMRVMQSYIKKQALKRWA
jgi:hypothetical protein